MHFKIVGGLLLLVTKVLAGGYAGALERCRSWDHIKRVCMDQPAGRDKWREFEGTPKKNRCTFSEFLNSIGGVGRKERLVADEKGNVLELTDPKATDPDPQETAKNVYTHFKNSPQNSVPDYQPFKVLKYGTSDYTTCIKRIGDLVVKAKVDKMTKENAHLFDRFAETTSLIVKARVGDHGRWLIDAAEKNLKPQNIEVVRESIPPGYNPSEVDKKWETVDWEKTIAGALDGGAHSPQEVLLLTSNMKEEFYANAKSHDHRVTIEAFSSVEKKVNGC
ncbi:hypothetical protein DCS_02031 [Drechmeria coniospora]|uniref:Uncharacterized protein n=1 Tax=Drechmeria coniospora TaxID=98403 RepID=A0A151GV35_DRECN|nr:hypothetical protein DCS_02031 [Drechmeria coniospora]KYK60892.1 hypothetical protein DCS_02031 [Drechmeria coniospora]